MTEALTQPGFYDIQAAELHSAEGGMVDVSSSIYSITITESMDSDFIQGQITIVDTVNGIQSLPIRGEEQLLLRIKDSMNEIHEYKLVCYKVSKIEPHDDGTGVSYTLHFTSEGRFFGNLTRVKRAFEESLSKAAQIIFDDYYKNVTDKKLALEESDAIHRFIIPNMLAREAMHFLAERAYSEVHKSSSFRFFETKKEFVFATDEWCIERGRKKEDRPKLTFVKNLTGSGENKVELLNNILQLTAEGNNSMRDINHGAYRHRVREIDLVYRMVNDYDYEYTQQYEPLDDDAQPSHSEPFVKAVFHDPAIKSFMVFKDYASLGDPATSISNYHYSPEVISNRIGFSARLANTSVNARLNGRLDICAGDVVTIDVPAFAIDRTEDTNLVMGGNFLVRSVSHDFRDMRHQTSLTLNKYEWSGKK